MAISGRLRSTIPHLRALISSPALSSSLRSSGLPAILCSDLGKSEGGHGVVLVMWGWVIESGFRWVSGVGFDDMIPAHKNDGLLESLPIPSRSWESVFMDFISTIPKSKGITIIVVVDRFIKYASLIPTPTDYKANETILPFLKNMVKYWGFPRSIVSDRDPRETSKFWMELFKRLGTDLNFSTNFHPQTDGQTE
ncbi:Transposon Ty3-G Gag-Pol polyprotein-like protein [Drosera capensis]